MCVCRMVVKRLIILRASLEDIIVAKLYSARATDIRDIESESVVTAVDWELLEKLATDEHEARANALNEKKLY